LLRRLTGLRGNIIEKYCSVSFDVWGTLIDLNYMLRRIAYVAAEKKRENVNLYNSKVLEAYEKSKMLRRRNPEITPNQLLEESKEIMAEKLMVDIGTVDNIIGEAFRTAEADKAVYQDVIPTLDELSRLGLKIGVTGNVLFWPSRLTISLLEKVGLSKYFSIYVFSDEIGYSKPDREAFLKYAETAECEPERVIHVGDNVVEDVGGALSAGFYAVLIQRSLNDSVVVKALRTAVVNDMRELLRVIEHF
jgi:putative hydrolase of the HAD superfamily